MFAFTPSAVSAWATVALAVLALVTAIYARLAWRSQNAELKALNDQNEEQRKLTTAQIPVLNAQAADFETARQERVQEAYERRKEHVNHVFVWAKVDNQNVPAKKVKDIYSTGRAHLKNTGHMPIYDVTFSWRVGDELGYLDPSESAVRPNSDVIVSEWKIDKSVAGSISVVAFIRDANGNRWRIHADGRHDLLSPDEWPPQIW